MKLYEVYENTTCPRCGHVGAADCGPYDYEPAFDDALGGPPDDHVHLMVCHGCRSCYDVAPAEWQESPAGQAFIAANLNANDFGVAAKQSKKLHLEAVPTGGWGGPAARHPQDSPDGAA